MATWTEVEYLGFYNDQVRFVCLMDDKIYFLYLYDDEVYEYDPGTDTLTMIASASGLANTTHIESIAVFGGKLYFLTYDLSDHGIAKVVRWAGSLESVTDEYEIYNEDPEGVFYMANLYADDDVLVSVLLHSSDGAPTIYGGTTHYLTSVGGSWTETIWYGSYVTFDNTMSPELTEARQFPQGIHEKFINNWGKSPNWHEYGVYKFSTVNNRWEVVKQDDSLWGYQRSSAEFEELHWVEETGSYTDDDWETKTNTGADDEVLFQWDMPHDYALNFEDFREFNGTGWTTLDTDELPSGILAPATVLRLSDESVYLVLQHYTGEGAEYFIFKRGEDIEGEVPTFGIMAEFWSGVDGLTKQSDLPFALATPDAMAINDLNVAALGADLPQLLSDPMIIFSGSYTQWGDAGLVGMPAEAVIFTIKITSLRWQAPCVENVGVPQGIELRTNTGKSIVLGPGDPGQVLVTPGDPDEPPYWKDEELREWPAPGEIIIGTTKYASVADAAAAAVSGDVVYFGPGTHSHTGATFAAGVILKGPGVDIAAISGGTLTLDGEVHDLSIRYTPYDDSDITGIFLNGTLTLWRCYVDVTNAGAGDAIAVDLSTYAITAYNSIISGDISIKATTGSAFIYGGNVWGDVQADDGGNIYLYGSEFEDSLIGAGQLRGNWFNYDGELVFDNMVPADGQTNVWDAANSKWIIGDAGSAGGADETLIWMGW